MPTRNINLTTQLDDFVAAGLRDGRYKNASEVVREGLRLLQHRDEVEALRRQAFEAEIAAAVADIDAGRFDEFDNLDDLHAHLSVLQGEVRSSQ
jgi:antitoxin ParD1/3/4